MGMVPATHDATEETAAIVPALTDPHEALAVTAGAPTTSGAGRRQECPGVQGRADLASPAAILVHPASSTTGHAMAVLQVK